MELLKQEYKRFQNEFLIDVLECGLCQKSSCEYHNKFFIGCDRCRKAQCQPCISFKIAKQALLQNFDNEGRKYVENFIKDFLNLTNKTLKESFAVTKVTLPRVQNYNVKSYHKSKKCRSLIEIWINVRKSNTQLKGESLHIIKNFNFREMVEFVLKKVLKKVVYLKKKVKLIKKTNKHNRVHQEETKIMMAMMVLNSNFM